MRSLAIAAVLAMFTLTGCSASLPLVPWSARPRVDLGPAVGEVSETTAILWARCSRPGQLHVALQSGDGKPAGTYTAPATAARDHTGRVQLGPLLPGTPYEYRAWCADGTRNRDGGFGAASGAFRTAPLAGQPAALRIAWGGDVGGQNVCRDKEAGYAIFDRVAEQRPDFFVALGDMIYADDTCSPVGRYGNAQLEGPAGPARTVGQYRDWWRYNAADPALRRFLSTTPLYAVWDDHEIGNDAGPRHDTLPEAPDRHLLPVALQAYLDYQPLLPPAEAPTRLYRSVRWGRHVELFLLDTRQYRDANFADDTGPDPKTMLGDVQRRWLIDAVTASEATWKIVACSVPISVPTGRAGRDGWADFDSATGFERELSSILRELWEAQAENLVFLSTDVHFGAVFRYTPFAEDPRFRVHEFISGPLNAGVFPKNEFDTSLGTERLFFYGPATAEDIRDFAAATGWFNFGVLDLNAAGVLTARLVNGTGLTVFRKDFFPVGRRRR